LWSSTTRNPLPWGFPCPRDIPRRWRNPTTSWVWEKMKDMDDHSDPFKQIYVMYFVSTVLSPKTRNHVSNRWYPIMVSSFSYCIRVL
jgi:hypothetical protein